MDSQASPQSAASSNSGRDLCGCATGSGPESGSVLSGVYRGLAAVGRMAGKVRRHHGSDGIDWRLLDPAIRFAGAIQGKTMLAQCAQYEKRTGTAHGLA